MLRCELQQGWAPPKPPPGQVDPGSLQRTEIPGLSQGKIPASAELRAGDRAEQWPCLSLAGDSGIRSVGATVTEQDVDILVLMVPLDHLPHPEELGDTGVALLFPILLLGRCFSGMLCVNFSHLA